MPPLNWNDQVWRMVRDKAGAEMLGWEWSSTYSSVMLCFVVFSWMIGASLHPEQLAKQWAARHVSSYSERHKKQAECLPAFFPFHFFFLKGSVEFVLSGCQGLLENGGREVVFLFFFFFFTSLFCFGMSSGALWKFCLQCRDVDGQIKIKPLFFPPVLC